jgi:ribosome-binding factor A
MRQHSSKSKSKSKSSKSKSGRGKAEQAKGPSLRVLRVGELIRHKLAEMLVRGEIHDNVLASHVVTVPEVRMSPDLKLATAYVMPLGGKDAEPVLKALERNKKYIRSEIAQTLDLRYAPDIRFLFDKTFEEVNRIDQLLHSPKVRADVEKD